MFSPIQIALRVYRVFWDGCASALGNSANIIRGMIRFYKSVILSSQGVRFGSYLLWQDGFAIVGAPLPSGLKRSTLSDNKRLMLRGWHVRVPAGKRVRAASKYLASIGAYQRGRTKLYFDPRANVVVRQTSGNHKLASTAILWSLADIFPNPIIREESVPSRIVMEMIWSDNLAQVGTNFRVQSITALLERSALAPGQANSLGVEDVFDRYLNLGAHVGPETKSLRTFLSCPAARHLLGYSPWVATHGDLNLFNVLIDPNGLPSVIDFDPRKVRILPRWFDPLILIRQCGAEEYLRGEFDDLLRRILCKELRSTEMHAQLLDQFRNDLFTLALALEAPYVEDKWELAPKGLGELEDRISSGRKRFNPAPKV